MSAKSSEKYKRSGTEVIQLYQACQKLLVQTSSLWKQTPRLQCCFPSLQLPSAWRALSPCGSSLPALFQGGSWPRGFDVHVHGESHFYSNYRHLGSHPHLWFWCRVCFMRGSSRESSQRRVTSQRWDLPIALVTPQHQHLSTSTADPTVLSWSAPFQLEQPTWFPPTAGVHSCCEKMCGKSCFSVQFCWLSAGFEKSFALEEKLANLVRWTLNRRSPGTRFKMAMLMTSHPTGE